MKFLSLAVVNFALMLLAYPLVPIAVSLADKNGRLPKAFRWFETHDDLGWGAGTYEHAVKAVFDKYGKRVALIYWLWRNKAYTFRNKLRARPNFDTMTVHQTGTDKPPKWGFFYSKWVVKDQGKEWFDTFAGCSFGKFHVYLRMGWKVKPIVQGQRPTEQDATGMFSGISIRSDDWDDYADEAK